MNKKHSMRFAARPLSAAILMALATPAAFAAVTATQLPGVGQVTYNTGAAIATSSTAIGNAQSSLTITVPTTSPVVIQWGGTLASGVTQVAGNATISPTGTAGFNIGSAAAVEFKAATANTNPILNIDATGNPSMILGTMTGVSVGAVYVANANGIVVGAGSVIDLPNGLGLINADETSSNAQAVFEAGAVPVSFQGATGGVTISAGANLASVGTFLLVAGAGNVNVAGAFVSNGSPATTAYAISDTIPVTVDAGVGGYFSGTTFTPQDYSAAQTFGSLSTSNYSPAVTTSTNPTPFSYQDAANSAVNLNLGTTTSPYDASTSSLNVLANGNINLASGSDLTEVQPTTFNWTGMLTNNGVMDYGDQTGSTLVTTTNPADIGANGSIYANTTTAQYGGFDNATSGLVNAGGIAAYGSSFSNAGTLQMGQASGDTPSLVVMVSSGNINLGGTVSVVSATSAYSGPLFLSDLELLAAFTAGQSVTVDTSPLLVSGGGSAVIAATNVNLGSSLTVSSGGDFLFAPYGVYSNASAAPVSGSFVIASGAALSAPNLYLGSNGAVGMSLSSSGALEITGPGNNTGPAYTSYKINGSMVATGTAASDGAFLGGDNASVFNVSGAGSITAGNLTFNNLLGSVNNITTGQILANGFQVNAPTGGEVNISVDAIGSAPQGFNLNVNGNASISSGDTQAVSTQTPAGNQSYIQYLMPANANSNLVVQASGNLTVNAGSYSNYGLTNDFFQWPGLIYLQANGGQLTSTTAIANAYAAQASTGHAGVFLVADNITDNNPIYTNGNAGVVFAAPYSASQGGYAYASTINGIDPTKANPSLPTVYFATPNPTVANANFSLQVLNSFINEHGYQQENQTFLTLSPNQ